jgi:hypothetical protein
MTTIDTLDPVPAVDPVAAGSTGPRRTRESTAGRVTRRHLQVALGVLWLLDGVLQLQPFMFSSRFADQVIAPVAAGQPAWVAWPVRHAASVIGAHPVPANLGFALVQLALGVAFLIPRTVRPAVVGSVVWAVSVWYLGEGLGGLAGGTASLLAGAPGAVALYALLALAAWPGVGTAAGHRRSVPTWFPVAWAVVWLDLALVALLPANRSAGAVRDQVVANSGQVPGWLAHVDHRTAAGVGHLGIWAPVLLAVVPAVIGLLGLGPVRQRRVAAGAGIGLALAAWGVGQGLGLLVSGSATDPNTGPLLALCGVALLGVVAPGQRQATAAPEAV